MKAKHYINSLRDFRVWHRILGVLLALFVIISASTGILLALKKDVSSLQPPTQKGMTNELKEWKSLEELTTMAQNALTAKEPEIATVVDRLDVRPNKGIVKVLFENGWWEVQVDGKSGEILSVARRHSDWIEALHDGSIVSDGFKLISMNLLGLGLLVMVLTGLWLWYGPKMFRRSKKRKS